MHLVFGSTTSSPCDLISTRHLHELLHVNGLLISNAWLLLYSVPSSLYSLFTNKFWPFFSGCVNVEYSVVESLWAVTRADELCHFGNSFSAKFISKWKTSSGDLSSVCPPISSSNDCRREALRGRYSLVSHFVDEIKNELTANNSEDFLRCSIRSIASIERGQRQWCSGQQYQQYLHAVRPTSSAEFHVIVLWRLL